MRKITFFIILYFSIFNNFAFAYSINPSASPIANSIFEKNPLQFSPIDLNKFTKSDSSGLSFSDLLNVKSFSSKDIGSGIKAVLILFIKLIITTLNVTLGILKALVDILTKAF